MTRKQNIYLVGIGLGLLCAALVILADHMGLLYPLDFFAHDLWFKLRGPEAADSRIVIVSLDDQALLEDKEEKPLIFWGDRIANVITQVREAGAKVIGLDIVPKILSSPWLKENFPDPDRALLAALSSTDNLVMIYEIGPGTTAMAKSWFMGVLPAGEEALGFSNLTPDRDTVIRRQKLWIKAPGREEKRMASFSFKLAQNFTGKEKFELPGQHSMLDEGEVWINFAGPSGSYRTISLHKVRAGSIFKGALVLIGAGYNESKDFYMTPFSSKKDRVAGVEVHANIIDTLINDKGLRPISREIGWAFLIFSALGLGAVFSSGRLARDVLYLIGACLFFFFLGFVLFSNFRLVLGVGPYLTLAPLSYGVVYTWRRLTVEKEKRTVEKTFSRYVGSKVLEHLIENPQFAFPGGQKKEITILFSDFRGFTTLSEKMDPYQVLKLLNDCFYALAPIIEEYNGTLDKFMGDGIMAFFGAPVPQEDHPARAVKCGLEMLKKMEELNLAFERTGRPRLRMGVGIHTGTAIVGNVGTADRMDYTAIGNVVNATQRIEEYTKVVRESFLASWQTYEWAKSILGENCPQVKANYQAQLVGLERPISLVALEWDKEGA